MVGKRLALFYQNFFGNIVKNVRLIQIGSFKVCERMILLNGHKEGGYIYD
ncbi:predicted protein [Enterococcus faecalis ARO1/DG]|nr:predicted protein [Enterococcus faecalis ARO1/DG]